MVSTSPARIVRVKGVSAFSTRRNTDWQRYWRHSLRMSAPGRRPASHRIWKPLHDPSTRPPSATKSLSAAMTGDRAATAPALR